MINEAYFSPGNDCKNAIIDEINKATKSIKICVFTISDNDISRAIEEAYQRRIEIKIITDDDKSNDKGSDIYTLFHSGIEIKTDRSENHMHHKFAIIDDEILISGSFNWTRSASKYNQENIIITDNSVLISKFQNQFEFLWKSMQHYY